MIMIVLLHKKAKKAKKQEEQKTINKRHQLAAENSLLPLKFFFSFSTFSSTGSTFLPQRDPITPPELYTVSSYGNIV